MTAKKYLQRIQMIDTIIKNKIVEKAQYMAMMYDRATSTTASTEWERVKSSGSQQKMADTIDLSVDYERRIERRIAELTAEKEEIIATIEQLPEDKYDLLHLCYVQHKTLKQVAAIRHESYSLVTTNHGIALSMVDAILAERKATICN